MMIIIECVVKTDVVGSESSFEIEVDESDWAGMDEGERHKEMMACLWGSGILDIYMKNKGDDNGK